MENRKHMDSRSQESYVEGMKRYQNQGIRILIDGEEATEEAWARFFEVREDNGYYMGDYIFEEQEPGGPGKPEDGQLQEGAVYYGKNKKLKEIHFNLVYNE